MCVRMCIQVYVRACSIGVCVSVCIYIYVCGGKKGGRGELRTCCCFNHKFLLPNFKLPVNLNSCPR